MYFCSKFNWMSIMNDKVIFSKVGFESILLPINRFHEERNRLEDEIICSKHKQVVSLQTK